MDIRWMLAAVSLSLAGCAGLSGQAPEDEGPPPPPPPPAPLMTCKADAVQAHVGQIATPELGARIAREAGARSLRWAPPRSAMTMDYRTDRVNVFYDDGFKITQITCG